MTTCFSMHLKHLENAKLLWPNVYVIRLWHAFCPCRMPLKKSAKVFCQNRRTFYFQTVCHQDVSLKYLSSLESGIRQLTRCIFFGKLFINTSIAFPMNAYATSYVCQIPAVLIKYIFFLFRYLRLFTHLQLCMFSPWKIRYLFLNGRENCSFD